MIFWSKNGLNFFWSAERQHSDGGRRPTASPQMECFRCAHGTLTCPNLSWIQMDASPERNPPDTWKSMALKKTSRNSTIYISKEKNSLFVCEWMFGLFCFDQKSDKNYIVHGGHHCKHEWNMNMLKHTNQSRMWHMNLHLMGGWSIPLKNMSSSVGMMTFPIYGKS